jgi:hypothetical protein
MAGDATTDGRLRSLEMAVRDLQGEVRGLKAENARLRGAAGPRAVATEDGRVGYPIDDQHDTLSLALTDVQAASAAAAIDREADQISWTKIEDLWSKGAVPEASVRQWQLTLKLDELNRQSLAEQVATVQTKLKSLEGLKENNLPKFHQYDRETNYHQAEWYALELKKAQATADHSAVEFGYLDASYENGATPWGTWFAAKADKLKTAAAVEGWRTKLAEQRRQLAAAQANLEPPSGSAGGR